MSALSGAIHALKGCQVMEIGRTLNIVVLRFVRDGVNHRLHAQCPFRAVRGAQILLGSYDMHWPKECKTDKDVAFDSYNTMFDVNAKALTDGSAARKFHVVDAEMSEKGEIALEITDSIRFEVFPASSGPVESWRLFARAVSSTMTIPKRPIGAEFF
jgi:hypothetical protein